MLRKGCRQYPEPQNCSDPRRMPGLCRTYGTVYLARTYGTEVAGAWCGVKAQQQPGDGDHVVLHEGLWGSRAT